MNLASIRKAYFFISFLVLNLLGPYSYAQFNVDGSAYQNCHEFTITDPVNSQRGGFFSNSQIDISAGFDLLFSVKFGCDNIGGEGVAFVLFDGNSLGAGQSYDLGYANLAIRSIAVEFDTRNNDNTTGSGPVNNQDPVYDHMDVMVNGNINHYQAGQSLVSNQLGSPAVAGNGNIEDCEFHDVRIVYDVAPSTPELSVYFDNVDVGTSTPAFTISVDLSNSTYLNNNMVNWGWTGTTGAQPGNKNHQVVKLALNPSFTATSSVCPGTPVNFNGTAEAYNTVVSYDWDFDGDGTYDVLGNQNPTHTFPTPGDYDVIMRVTDDQGCVSTDTLNYSIGFGVTIEATPNQTCPGGTSQLEAVPDPYVSQECEYILTWGDTWGDGWDNNEIELFVDGVSEGTYTMLDIGTPSSNSVSLMLQHGADVEICYHQTNNATAEGEIYYSLADNGGTTIIDVQPGDIPTSTPNGTDVCQQAVIDCGLTPPTYDYSWTVTSGSGTLNSNNIADPVATNNTASVYEVTVTDQATGCTVTEDTLINIAPPVTANISGNPTVCEGDLADLTITFTGGAPFEIVYQDPNSNNQTVSNISANPYTLQVTEAGTYTLVSVTGAGGCTGTVSGAGTATVTTIPKPDVTLSADVDTCDGYAISPLTVTSSNGGTVTWYDDNTLTNVLTTGNSYTPGGLSVGQNIFYAQEEENVMGCAGDYDSVIVTVYAVPPAPTITGATDYCDGDPFTALTANGLGTGYFTWYDGSGNFLENNITHTPNLSVGTHVIQLTETVNGCESPTGSITINVKETPPAPTMSADATYCDGETLLDMTATDNIGGTITWSSDPNGTNVLGTGSTLAPSNTIGTTTYYATETLNGCTGPTGEVDITVNEVPYVEVPSEVEICAGDSVYIEAQHNGFPITWTSGDSGPNVWLGPATTTTYLVNSSNNCGDDQDTIKVIVYDPPTIFASNDITTGLGGEVELNATGALSYDWDPEPNECLDANCREVYVIPTQTTTYVVTGTDANGCIGTDTVVVTINGEMQIFVPNIFSPNGDGWNDEMVIRGPRLFNFKLMVFDRWGKLIYEADDQRDYWDGTFNGKPADQGVYVYRITGKNVLDIEVDQKGNITLVR